PQAIKRSAAVPFIFMVIYGVPNTIYYLFKKVPLLITSSSDSFRYVPFWTDFYYSVVTFATLGYGEIHPKNALGQALSIVEVALGYTMLGVLVSVIARKMSR
ncbi:MAG TPA: two pore domain potassium channel family protein, partial [Proteobacteria bacterium]|nr:two pore domain potassium channel family protein [Pseudomonadota bacterium]